MNYLGVTRQDLEQLNIAEEHIEKVKLQFEEIKKEFSGNSERGIVIISASILDEVLRNLLESHLVECESKKEKDSLFSNNAPLSTFSNKIEMSYRLGLVTKKEKDKLNTIRSIRNKFAHQISGESFGNQSIIDKCRELKFPDDMLVSLDMSDIRDNQLIIKRPADNNYIEIFQNAIYILLSALSARHALALYTKRHPPKDFEHRYEMTSLPKEIEKLINENLLEIIENEKNQGLSTYNDEEIEKINKIFTDRLAFHEKVELLMKNAIVLPKD